MFLLISKICRFINNGFLEFFLNPLVVNACTFLDSKGNIRHDNWGDDINYFFIKEIIKRRWILYAEAPLARFFHRPNYVIIGSVIDMLSTPDSIVWGAGLITGNPKNIVQPKKICAVRGPKTRNVLLSRGIDCPEVYGDPALLLPLYYKPKVQKRYRIGIIPHYADFDILSEKFSNNKEMHFIRISGYEDWKTFINEVNECECIVSTSLHGLIISESYGIPNIWIQNADGIIRDTFKFDDFYASIDKSVKPLVLNDNITVDYLIQKCNEWQQGKIELKPLIDACPFEINIFL